MATHLDQTSKAVTRKTRHANAEVRMSTPISAAGEAPGEEASGEEAPREEAPSGAVVSSVFIISTSSNAKVLIT